MPIPLQTRFEVIDYLRRTLKTLMLAHEHQLGLDFRSACSQYAWPAGCNDFRLGDVSIPRPSFPEPAEPYGLGHTVEDAVWWVYQLLHVIVVEYDPAAFEYRDGRCREKEFMFSARGKEDMARWFLMLITGGKGTRLGVELDSKCWTELYVP